MNLEREELKAIETILMQRIGIEPSSLGVNAVERAVADRMRSLGINDIGEYAGTMSQSNRELDALTELVAVPETWFFRDREPFVFLAKHLVSSRDSRNPKPPRILSAPCSTGEEPYSIAMTCLDCGLGAGRFGIDAADISAGSLEKAQKAVYGANAFRGADLSFRDRHFTRHGENYTLNPGVCANVRFFKANILDNDFPPGAPPYDIVFCRNLLIYLHERARAKILAIIGRLLAPGGLLFTGHAETTCAQSEIFEPMEPPGAFVLRKLAQTKARPPEPAAAARRPERGQIARTWPGSQKPNPRPVLAAAKEQLENATRLADAGHLHEAAEACRRILSSDKCNARAYFLLGLVEEARGENAAAAECFNRAIYLETGFSDAIVHLATLKEQCGDAAGAELLRRRANALAAEEGVANR